MIDDSRSPEIRAWLASEAEVEPPNRLFEHVFDATRAMPQLRAWPASLPLPVGWISRRGLVLAVAVMLAIAFGVGVFAGGGRWLLGQTRPAPAFEVRGADLFAPTCSHPNSITVVGGSVWVACVDQLRRFDGTGAVTGVAVATAMALDPTGAWVVGVGGLRSIDPSSFALGIPVPLPDVVAIALDGSSVWAAQSPENRLVRLDRASGKLLATVQLSSRPSQLVAGAGRIWVLLPDANQVAVIDPNGNVVRDLVSVSHPVAITSSSGSMWVVNGNPASSLSQIDPRDLATTATGLPADVAGVGRSAEPGIRAVDPAVAGIDDMIWVVDGPQLEELDPSTLALVRVIQVRDPGLVPLGGVASLGGQLLVLDTSGNRVLRVTP